MSFLRVMASTGGRVFRVVIGIALIVFGWSLGGSLGTFLIVFGFLPILTGVFDICLLGPVFGLSFSGRKVREHFKSG